MSSFACIIFFFSAAVKSAQAAKILDLSRLVGLLLVLFGYNWKGPRQLSPRNC